MAKVGGSRKVVPKLLDFGNRLGRFRVAEALIDQHPEAVMRLMGRCVVIRVAHHVAEQFYEYMAMSPDFDVWDGGGGDVPVYEAEARQQFGSIYVSFQRGDRNGG